MENNKHQDKYIYDNGFKNYYYTCQKCGSHKVLQVPAGGFSPPDLHCEDCGCKDVVNSPTTISKEEMGIEPQEFKIEVCRIGYGYRTIKVKAFDQTEAEQLALEEAGNYEFSEKDAEYKIF